MLLEMSYEIRNLFHTKLFYSEFMVQVFLHCEITDSLMSSLCDLVMWKTLMLPFKAIFVTLVPIELNFCRL